MFFQPAFQLSTHRTHGTQQLLFTAKSNSAALILCTTVIFKIVEVTKVVVPGCSLVEPNLRHDVERSCTKAMTLKP